MTVPVEIMVMLGDMVEVGVPDVGGGGGAVKVLTGADVGVV